jgi:hypothetical protein
MAAMCKFGLESDAFDLHHLRYTFIARPTR